LCSSQISKDWKWLRFYALYVAIVQVLRDAGCAGATVTRAIASYGAGVRLREPEARQWSSDAPVVDQPARLQRLIPRLQEMMQGGLMTMQETEQKCSNTPMPGDEVLVASLIHSRAP
jgi:PII-like signaling protein